MTCPECGAEKGANIDCATCSGPVQMLVNICYLDTREDYDGWLKLLSLFVMHHLVPMCDALDFYDEGSYLREAAKTSIQTPPKPHVTELDNEGIRRLAIELQKAYSACSMLKTKKEQCNDLIYCVLKCSDIYHSLDENAAAAKIDRCMVLLTHEYRAL